MAGDTHQQLDIELLTIKLRLLVASADKAEQMGISWVATTVPLRRGHPPRADERLAHRSRLAALAPTGGRGSGDQAAEAPAGGG